MQQLSMCLVLIRRVLVSVFIGKEESFELRLLLLRRT
jgi:hypothetical protein